MTASLPLPASSAALTGRLIALRRRLHAWPELAFQETRTARLIARTLVAQGLSVRTGIAGTGVAGLLHGQQPGPRTLLIRADMDALPLHEVRDVPYRSRRPHIMHACGHDAHVAMALGAAALLAERAALLHGQVLFAFEPAEEGSGGAQPMIDAGLLDDPPVTAAVGLHLWNELPCGEIGVLPGPFMAASDALHLRLAAPPRPPLHAATPHLGADAIAAAAAVLTATQALFQRSVPPTQVATLTFGRIQGGQNGMTVADTVEMEGLLRVCDPALRDHLLASLPTTVHHVAAALGVQATVTVTPLCPPLVNDPALSALAQQVARQTTAVYAVGALPSSTWADDMACFLRAVPGCYIFVGSADASRGLDAPHHDPLFDFDERALPIGAELLARFALAYLATPPPS